MKQEIYISNDETKQIQNILLSILKDFDSFCKENDIKYFVVAGTALGVVRHKGFIPWDDDIDVGMDHHNYQKFLKLAKNNMNSQKYFVQNYDTEKNINNTYTKIRLNNSIYCEKSAKKMNIHKGFWIDIFPFYNIPDDDKEWKKMSKKWRLYERLYGCRQCGYSNYTRGTFIVRIIKRFISRILHYVLLILPTSFFLKKIEKICTSYNAINTKRIGYKDFNFYLEKRELYPLKELAFEDMMVYAPNDINHYLTHHYGNYMQLPPISERKTHRPLKIIYKEKTIL